MPSTRQPRLTGGAGDLLDHLAADGDDDDARAVLPGGGLHVAERLPVEDGLVHRHRDVVGRLHPDGGGERLLVLQRRQVERADDDPLVGDTEAHALRDAVLVEERLQRLRQGGDVGDLAVAQDAGAKGGHGATLERHRTVDGDLGGGDVAGIEVEADDRGLGGGALLEHVRDIGGRRPGLNDEAGPGGPASPKRSGVSRLPLAVGGQPYLPLSVQVRVTAEPPAVSVLVIVNLLPLFEVTSTA